MKKEINQFYERLETLTRIANAHRKGQVIEVAKDGKKFNIKITQPNSKGGSRLVGTANGKTYICELRNFGDWVVIN